MGREFYREHFPKIAEGLARQGRTNAEIAAHLEISETTFYNYLKKFPEFAEAVKRGKAPVDFDVETSLLKLATGYDATEIQEEAIIDAETGEEVKTKRKTVTKHVPPSVSAAMFWLKNRLPDNWRERQKDEQKHNINLHFDKDDEKL
jgi:transposase